MLFSLGIPYNRPKLCPNATWNTTAVTFASSDLLGANPWAIFVNTNNTIYAANRQIGMVRVWREASSIPIQNISGNLSTSYSLFVSDDNQVYIDNGENNRRVDKWSPNSNTIVAAMYMCGACYGLLIDTNNNLYCSIYDRHEVILRSLDSRFHVWTVVAGTGTAGTTPTTLYGPRGLAMDNNLNLYVADTLNSRIQRFPFQQLNGTTVVGAAVAGTISLYYPSAVILDADGYIFIADTFNQRIIGSNPSGYRCIAGCAGQTPLSYPTMMSFDSYGNLYIMDYGNHRIQKVLLSSNPCGKSGTAIDQIN